MYERKLPLNILKTDLTYQSPVRKSQVNAIVKNFDPKALHTIVVSKRDDGSHYIVDGQHRVNALGKLGYFEIRCTVHVDLTVEEEAKMYEFLNTRPSKSPVAKAKARMRHNDVDALRIDDVVTNAGLRINYDHGGEKKGHINAYGTLERIYKKHGDIHLNNVIMTLKISFGENGKNFQSYLLEGVSKFLETYGEDIDFRFLTKRLMNIGYENFVEKVENEKHKFRTKKECLTFAIVDIYNYNKKKNILDKRKLLV